MELLVVRDAAEREENIDYYYAAFAVKCVFLVAKWSYHRKGIDLEE